MSRPPRRPGCPRLVIATVTGLAGYRLLRTASPRLLDAGFTDGMASCSASGGGAAPRQRSPRHGGVSIQLAAFPSLHVGWAMWVALCLRDHARRPVVRRWSWIRPALMSVVVVGTANHYLVDALAGIACVVVAHWLAGKPSGSTRSDR